MSDYVPNRLMLSTWFRSDGGKHLFENNLVSVNVSKRMRDTDENSMPSFQLIKADSSTPTGLVCVNERPKSDFLKRLGPKHKPV